MDDAITMLEPDTSTFTTLLMKIAVDKPSDIHFWIEDELFPRFSWDKRLWGEWDWVG